MRGAGCGWGRACPEGRGATKNAAHRHTRRAPGRSRSRPRALYQDEVLYSSTPGLGCPRGVSGGATPRNHNLPGSLQCVAGSSGSLVPPGTGSALPAHTLPPQREQEGLGCGPVEVGLAPPGTGPSAARVAALVRTTINFPFSTATGTGNTPHPLSAPRRSTPHAPVVPYLKPLRPGVDEGSGPLGARSLGHRGDSRPWGPGRRRWRDGTRFGASGSGLQSGSGK